MDEREEGGNPNPFPPFLLYSLFKLVTGFVNAALIA